MPELTDRDGMTRGEVLRTASALALAAVVSPSSAGARTRTAHRPVLLARGGRFPQG